MHWHPEFSGALKSWQIILGTRPTMEMTDKGPTHFSLVTNRACLPSRSIESSAGTNRPTALRTHRHSPPPHPLPQPSRCPPPHSPSPMLPSPPGPQRILLPPSPPQHT